MAAQPIYDDDDEVTGPVIQAEVEAAPGMITVDQLDGVPLFYARGPGAPAQHAFAFQPTFHDECVAIIRSVRHRVPDSYGKLKRITTAGTFVDKPGFHGTGRAMDHDRWEFEHVDIHPFKHDHASPDPKRRRRYWALAAIMRSHSAFLLHGEYNAEHRDHLHSDNGGGFPFDAGSEATVKLVQAICKHIFGSTALSIDGDFGPKSKAAVNAAMGKLELAGGITDPSQFKRFLMRSGQLGFALGA